MKKFMVLLFSLSLLTGCLNNTGTPAAAPVDAITPVAPAPPTPQQNLVKVLAQAGCAVLAVATGVQLSCADGSSAVIQNGPPALVPLLADGTKSTDLVYMGTNPVGIMLNLPYTATLLFYQISSGAILNFDPTTGTLFKVSSDGILYSNSNCTGQAYSALFFTPLKGVVMENDSVATGSTAPYLQVTGLSPSVTYASAATFSGCSSSGAGTMPYPIVALTPMPNGWTPPALQTPVTLVLSN